MGRPTLFTTELWESLLEWLEDGRAETDWCKAEPGRPKPCTIRAWVAKDADLKSAYDAAFDVGCDAIAERSRKTLRGKTEEAGGESTGDVIRDKAIAYHDLQLLDRWNARYRQGVKIEHSGHLRARSAAELSDDELASIAAGGGERIASAPKSAE